MVQDVEARLVKASVIARKLGVSEARVYELAKTGIIPCVRLGRQVRFVPGEIEKFVDSGGASLPHGWRNEPETVKQ